MYTKQSLPDLIKSSSGQSINVHYLRYLNSQVKNDVEFGLSQLQTVAQPLHLHPSPSITQELKVLNHNRQNVCRQCSFVSVCRVPHKQRWPFIHSDIYNDTLQQRQQQRTDSGDSTRLDWQQRLAPRHFYASLECTASVLDTAALRPPCTHTAATRIGSSETSLSDLLCCTSILLHARR